MSMEEKELKLRVERMALHKKGVEEEKNGYAMLCNSISNKKK